MLFFKKKEKTREYDLGIKKRHDELFGKGSWEKLEKEVLERHPQFKNI